MIILLQLSSSHILTNAPKQDIFNFLSKINIFHKQFLHGLFVLKVPLNISNLLSYKHAWDRRTDRRSAMRKAVSSEGGQHSKIRTELVTETDSKFRLVLCHKCRRVTVCWKSAVHEWLNSSNQHQVVITLKTKITNCTAFDLLHNYIYIGLYTNIRWLQTGWNIPKYKMTQ